MSDTVHQRQRDDAGPQTGAGRANLSPSWASDSRSLVRYTKLEYVDYLQELRAILGSRQLITV